MTGRDADASATARLEKLAAEISDRQYSARLVANPGRHPRLRVTNRIAAQLTEDIYCGGDFYWWGWAERIGPVADVAAAAAVIARVLAARES